MRISTKGSYGLKALVDLACYSTNEVVTIKSICERQEISERYLEQIFSLLRKNGIIIGRKGSQGGYALAKAPKELTLFEILKALEGDLNCRTKADNINELDKIINETVWEEVDQSVENLLKDKTLENLVEEYKKNRSEAYMYYI